MTRDAPQVRGEKTSYTMHGRRSLMPAAMLDAVNDFKGVAAASASPRATVCQSLSSVILSPVSCFCPGSAQSCHLMGSDEDRPANLRMRSLCVSYLRRCGLT